MWYFKRQFWKHLGIFSLPNSKFFRVILKKIGVNFRVIRFFSWKIHCFSTNLFIFYWPFWGGISSKKLAF